MDNALKAKWVEALRNGKYRQTQNYLHNADGFCCLGVLCDVASNGEGWREYDCTGIKRFSHPLSAGSTRYLGRHLEIQIGPRVGTLMDMNDNGKTFAQIADYIEEQL